MSDSERYITYPRVEDLYRMRTHIERSIGEIDYDMKRNKQQAEELVREREQAVSTLKQINAYIDAANKTNE